MTEHDEKGKKIPRQKFVSEFFVFVVRNRTSHAAKETIGKKGGLGGDRTAHGTAYSERRSSFSPAAVTVMRETGVR